MASHPVDHRISGSYDDQEKLLETPGSANAPYHYPQFAQYSHVYPYSSPTLAYSTPTLAYDSPDVKSPGVKTEGIRVGGVRPTNPRRYSGVWWKVTWYAAIEVGVWPRIIYSVVGALLIAAWIVLMFYFTGADNQWSKAQLQNLASQAFNLNTSVGMGGSVQAAGNQMVVGLMGSLKKFDPAGHTLSVEWSGFLKNLSAPVPSPEPFDLNAAFYYDLGPFNIYQDVSTVLYHLPNNTNWTYAIQGPDGNARTFTTPLVYRLDNTSTPHIGHLGMNEWDSIPTDISFGPKDSEAGSSKQPLLGYPYDEWVGNITFVAIDPWYETREFKANGTGIFPLAGATLSDNTLNWRFELEVVRSCDFATLEKDLDRLQGFVDQGYSLEYLPYPCDLKLMITGKRPELVKFAAISAVVVNWISTFFIFILTAEVIVMKREYMLSGTDLLGVALTALFALPTVRSLLPGAPDFGALNLVGIIPNIIIISVCVTGITIAKLRKVRGKED